jgi:hypothetical protein
MTIPVNRNQARSRTIRYGDARSSWTNSLYCSVRDNIPCCLLGLWRRQIHQPRENVSYYNPGAALRPGPWGSHGAARSDEDRLLERPNVKAVQRRIKSLYNRYAVRLLHNPHDFYSLLMMSQQSFRLVQFSANAIHQHCLGRNPMYPYAMVPPIPHVDTQPLNYIGF